MIAAVFIFGYIADLLSIVFVIMLSSMLMASFTHDERSKWNCFVAVLPVRTKEIVMSRYLYSLMLAVTGALISLWVRWISGLVSHNGTITDALVLAYALFAAALLFGCLLLPLAYVIREDQARVLIVPAAAVAMTAFYILRQISGLRSMEWVLFVTPLFLIILFILSFMVSYAVYRRREF